MANFLRQFGYGVFQWWVKLVKCLVKNKHTYNKKIIFEMLIMSISFRSANFVAAYVILSLNYVHSTVAMSELLCLKNEGA